MKKTVFLLLYILHQTSAYTQDYELVWQQCFGGSEEETARDIIKIPDGYFIAGYTFSIDGDISLNKGILDGWLIKTDNNGNMVWEKTYGGSSGDGIHRIFPDNNGNYYLLCGTGSSDGDISYDPYPNSEDYWIVKIDVDGNILWDKIVGGTYGDKIFTGCRTSDGGVVALGESISEDGDVTVHFGAKDVWAVKFSREGEVEWDITLGTDQTDYGQAIIQTTDRGYLVGCSTELEGGGNLNCTSHGLADGVLVKLDSLRNIEWQHCYGGSWYDGIIGLLEIEDGYIFLAYASTNDGDLEGSGWHPGINNLGNPTSDIWVVKVDYSGNIVWKKCFGGSQVDDSKNIIQLSDGSLMIFGNTDSHDGDVVGNHSGNAGDFDIWAIHISSEGELILQQCFGGWGDDRIEFGMVKNSDTDFVIAGQVDYGPSYDVDCTPHGGNWDNEYWIFEIKDTTVAVQENMQIAQLKVYSNPAKDYVTFEIPGFISQSSKETKIHIHDLFGREVVTKELASLTTILDLRILNNGIYFYRINYQDFSYSGKLMIQR